MNRALPLLLLAAALGAPAAAQTGDKPMAEAAFDVKPPKGWKLERRGPTAVMTGPKAEGLAAQISVRFVRSDHELYGTPEAYMKRLTKPSSIPLEGWTTGTVEQTKVAGLKALKLERDTTDSSDPHSMDAKMVAVREEHLAAAAKGGFYLLVYTAPRSIDDKQRKVFRRLVEKGFKPRS